MNPNHSKDAATLPFVQMPSTPATTSLPQSGTDTSPTIMPASWHRTLHERGQLGPVYLLLHSYQPLRFPLQQLLQFFLPMLALLDLADLAQQFAAAPRNLSENTVVADVDNFGPKVTH